MQYNGYVFLYQVKKKEYIFLKVSLLKVAVYKKQNIQKNEAV